MRNVNWSSPIDWNHPLNKGLHNWWLVVPHQRGGTKWRDLARGKDGVLTNMDLSFNGWVNLPAGGIVPRASWPLSIQFDGSNDQVVTPSIGLAGPPVTVLGWFAIGDTGRATYDGYTADDGVRGSLLRSGGSGNGLTYMWEGSADEYNGVTSLTIPNLTWFLGAVSITTTAATVYTITDNWLSVWKNTKTHNTYTMGVRRFMSDRNLKQPWGNTNDQRIYSRALTVAELIGYYEESRRGYPNVLNRPRRLGRVPDAAPAGGANLLTLLGVG